MSEGLQRGGMFGKTSPLDEILRQVAERQVVSEKILVYEGCPFDEMAWVFQDGIKNLTDCTKEELLYVCQVLVSKIPPVNFAECHVRAV